MHWAGCGIFGYPRHAGQRRHQRGDHCQCSDASLAPAQDASVGVLASLASCPRRIPGSEEIAVSAWSPTRLEAGLRARARALGRYGNRLRRKCRELFQSGANSDAFALADSDSYSRIGQRHTQRDLYRSSHGEFRFHHPDTTVNAHGSIGKNGIHRPLERRRPRLRPIVSPTQPRAAALHPSQLGP